MNDWIEPKPTVFAGRHFRSKLEASWAAWFDAMAWTWTYEPTPRIDDYQPDFLLEGAMLGGPLYVEVKPERYIDWLDRHLDDIERWNAHVRAAVPVPLLLIIGRPGIWSEGRLDPARLNQASILFWIDRRTGIASRGQHSSDLEVDPDPDAEVRSMAVWFTGCDRCREYGLAWSGEHLECACLRDRWQRIPRPMIQAAETVRNMAWTRHGADQEQLHHLNRR